MLNTAHIEDVLEEPAVISSLEPDIDPGTNDDHAPHDPSPRDECEDEEQGDKPEFVGLPKDYLRRVIDVLGDSLFHCILPFMRWLMGSLWKRRSKDRLFAFKKIAIA